VHVPFCAHKCMYCAFFSAPPQPHEADQFVEALIQEMEMVSPACPPRTVFFGGGTPSLLSLRQWERLLEATHRLGWLPTEEWTVECNPATLTPDKARLLREGGVNRLSLGVQSLDDALLQRLGRIHSRQMVFDTYDLVRQAGFDNINLDLMFAIPGQTLENWRATLAEIIAMGSEHLSSYEVTYEEDTPLYEQLQAGHVAEDEDLAAAMYEVLMESAEAGGFRQYEISNFARHLGVSAAAIPDRACQHNINYWRGGPYLGLGPSASEFLGQLRTTNVANTARYCELLAQGRRPIESRDELSPLARAGELAAFGLRMNDGWPFADFLQVTGFDFREHWAPAMAELIQKGHAEQDPRGFRLTRTGMRFADAAATMFLVV
jgi:oxygen-independent coproporphyrinogen III oxidase